MVYLCQVRRGHLILNLQQLCGWRFVIPILQVGELMGHNEQNWAGERWVR